MGGTLTATTIATLNSFVVSKPFGTVAEIVIGLAFIWVTVGIAIVAFRIGKWGPNIGTIVKIAVVGLFTAGGRGSAVPGTAGPGPGAAAGFGVRSMTAPLRRVLVRRPATTGDFAGAGWREPDPGLLARQHEEFCALLSGLGCEVITADAAAGLVDAVYVRDPGLVTGRGAVLFQMAKPARQAEPPLLGAGRCLGAGRRPAGRRCAGRRR